MLSDLNQGFDDAGYYDKDAGWVEDGDLAW